MRKIDEIKSPGGVIYLSNYPELIRLKRDISNSLEDILKMWNSIDNDSAMSVNNTYDLPPKLDKVMRSVERVKTAIDQTFLVGR